MQNRLKSQAESLGTAQDKLSHLETEFAKMTELFQNTNEELSGTKETLHKASVELKQARTWLKKTIEDRDTLTFLLKEHGETEANLYARSTELLGVVKDTTGDVDK